MHPFQKMAWYNLGVGLLTVSGFVGLYAASGHLAVSLAAFAIMALWAFAPLFVTGKGQAPVADEYLVDMNRRAIRVAGGVFWFYYVAGSMLLMLVSGLGKDIPWENFMAFFLTGWLIFTAAQAVSILVMYSSDSAARATLLDRFHRLPELRKTGLMGLFVMGFVGVGMLSGVLMARKAGGPAGFNAYVDISYGFSCLLFWVFLKRLVKKEQDRILLSRAKRSALIAMLVASTASAMGFAVVGSLKVTTQSLVSNLQFGVFYVLLIGILTFNLSLLLPHHDLNELQAKAADYK